jgi:hypothetical protein
MFVTSTIGKKSQERSIAKKIIVIGHFYGLEEA